MSLDSMIAQSESLTKAASRSYDPNAYNKLIIPDNHPLHLSFLVDRRRAGRFSSHWNDEAKCMDICDKTYGRDCKTCKKGKDGRPTFTLDYLAYNYEKVDSFREAKSSGEVYQENPLIIYSQRSGRNEVNFNYLNDMNGDVDQYYDFKNKNSRGFPAIKVEDLKQNELLFDIDSGNHKIYRIIKSVSEGKVDPKTGKKSKSTEYGTPQVVSRTQMEKLLPEKKGKLLIPADVRDKTTFALTNHDLFPHYLSHYGNVDWGLWELDPPEVGSAIGNTFVPKEPTDEQGSGKATMTAHNAL